MRDVAYKGGGLLGFISCYRIMNKAHITMAHVSCCCALWDWLSRVEETDGIGS